MDRIWTYHQHIYHENTNQQVPRYNIEALYRRYEEIWENHAGVVKMWHAFQTTNFEDRESNGNKIYESKHFWANRIDEYIVEAASSIQTEMYIYLNYWAQYLEWAELVTSQLSERYCGYRSVCFVLIKLALRKHN
jgi:hypothetical protein